MNELVKSFTEEEFEEYVQGLNFTDARSLVDFCYSYFADLQRTYKDTNISDEDLAMSYKKYCIVTRHFGGLLLNVLHKLLEENTVTWPAPENSLLEPKER